VTLLADIIVVVHALIAAFITLGFVAVPVGAWLNWRLVRCRWLRLVHLVSILFVAGETVLGFVCPLTAWEDWLRGGNANGAGFIARWVRWGLYYDAPLWMFAAIYVVAAVAAVLLWRWVPPEAPRHAHAPSKP
jgi:polyferredoxin